jgi:phosphate ABC transporter phosphate-binding protein
VDNKEQPPTPPVERAKSGNSLSRRILTIVSVIGILAVGCLAVGVYAFPSILVKEEKPPSYVHLKTGGTSVMYVMFQNKWRALYLKDKNVQLDYESTGSTAGVNQMIEKKLSIAFTHAPVSHEQREKAKSAGGEVIQFPIVVCGVAPIYNVPQLKGKKPVNFTGEVLAKIFLGTIPTWDHPDLKAINPELAKDLPPTPITVVHREDSSGTTLIFTDFLSKASAKWREKFPKGASEIQWPTGTGVNRNMEVAIRVTQIDGAIGYVDSAYTHFPEFETLLGSGAIQNFDKTSYLQANGENMTAAARQAISEVQPDMTFDIAYKPGPKSYPISGVIYAVCYRAQPEATRITLVDFLQWATHQGQDVTEKMSYAPLPPELIERVDKQLKLIGSAH